MSTAPVINANAFGRKALATYALPNKECLDLNKVNWPLYAHDAVLLIHDMQNYWLDMFVDAQALKANSQALHAACIKAKIPIIYCGAEKPKNLAERGLALDFWGPGIGAGQPSAQQLAVINELAPRPEDHFIAKKKQSAFFDTDLHMLLQRMGRRQIMLCGVFAHHGVLLTAIDGYMRNYKMFMVADAVADYSAEDHAMALRYCAEMCGQLVLTHTVLNAIQA